MPARRRRPGKKGRKQGHGPIPMEMRTNARFEEYYRAQGIIAEEEWPAFLAALRDYLPTNFRVSPRAANRELMLQRLEAEFQFPELGEKDEEGELIPRPRRLPWYPDGLAWQLDVTRKWLRKVPQLQDLHDWMIRETDCGNMSRSEAVSMIPPVFLGVEPHHRVLDMCAAPGSKTGQLIDDLHAQERAGVHPTGMVVANEIDSKRAFLLSAMTSRMLSDCVLITCHDARQIPMPVHPARPPAAAAAAAGGGGGDAAAGKEASGGDAPGAGPGAGAGAGAATAAGMHREGFYDRILADVPCSGDGTMRKNPDVWLSWSPHAGNVLHSTQVQIASRGLQLLRTGGRMVYSTCTFNPVENEAVIATVLRWAGGAVELEDCSARFPELRRRPGLTTWHVFDKGMTRWDDPIAVRDSLHNRFAKVRVARAAAEAEGRDPAVTAPEDPDQRAGRNALKNMHLSMWAPRDAAEAEALHLDRCMRLAPHDANTGGFFVCVLRKTGAVPATPPKLQRVSELLDAIRTNTSTHQWPEPKEQAAGGGGGAAGGGDGDGDGDDGSGGDSPTARAPAVKRVRGDMGADAADASGDVEKKDGAGDDNAEPASKPGATGQKRLDMSRPHPTGIPGLLSPDEVDDPNRSVHMQPVPEPIKELIAGALGLEADFPWHRLFMRNGSLNSIYMVSEQIARAIYLPEHAWLQDALARGLRQPRPRLKLVAPGKKVFELENRKATATIRYTDVESLRPLIYRPSGEGRTSLVPYMLDATRTLRVTAQQLDELLSAAHATGKLWDLSEPVSEPLRKSGFGTTLAMIDPAWLAEHARKSLAADPKSALAGLDDIHAAEAFSGAASILVRVTDATVALLLRSVDRVRVAEALATRGLCACSEILEMEQERRAKIAADRCAAGMKRADEAGTGRDCVKRPIVEDGEGGEGDAASGGAAAGAEGGGTDDAVEDAE